jgi:hypothetical protein
MPICTRWRGPKPTNKKGITLLGLGTYDIVANHVLVNISYVCKPCNPCQSACKHIIVCKPGACKHIICLQASLWTHLRTNAKRRLDKHPICNFLCRRIGTSEWWNDTFVLFYCWLEKGGAYHSSLHFSLGVGFGNFCLWVCLPDQRRVSLIYFPINFDSNTN